MADAGLELQKAILTRLRAVSAVTALVPSASIIDYVKQDASYPLIVVGDDFGADWGSKTFTGQEYDVTIHAWTVASGRKVLKQILSAIHAALHQQEANLTVTGFDIVLFRYVSSQTFIDEAVQPETDKYYHGIIRFRTLLIEQ